MPIRLEQDQIFWTYPSDGAYGHVPAYEYVVLHPFIRLMNCVNCQSFHSQCECSEDLDLPQLYECTLCGCKALTEDATSRPMVEPSHVTRMKRAEKERAKYMRIVDRWRFIQNEPALKRLKEDDSLSLPDSVLAATFRYIKAKSSKDLKEHTMAKATKMLRKYENMERLCILFWPWGRCSAWSNYRLSSHFLRYRNGCRRAGKPTRKPNTIPEQWALSCLWCSLFYRKSAT
jgi:hypothetical protein